nr:Rha family transcriptional regulator [uncultured Cellulosilyticum sp.]
MNQELIKSLTQGDNTPVILQGVQQDFTITSLEIAEMMQVRHSDVLQKLEGTTKADGTVKTKGIIPVLTQRKFPLSDYFIESTYIDGSGKKNKCYDCTKMGCELLANKFTGEKGITFSAKYVERFNKMELVLRNQLITNQNFLAEHFNVLLGTLTEKVNKLEAQAEFNHRPSHATKLNWNKVIKTYAKCQADEENIKHIVFAKFSISKWEDLTSDKFSEVFGYIREIAEKANLIKQVSLFDKKENDNVKKD